MIPTRDHILIRQWAESNDGVPAEITPLKFDGSPAVLHFLFGQLKNGTGQIRPISWDDFFAQFDLMKLSMAFDSGSRQFSIILLDKSENPKKMN